ITVIFITPFSGACCRIIEMILVISLRQQINVLKNRQLLNFCTKKQLRAQRRAAKRQGGPILLIKNNVFSFLAL
ncbi:hypothetical protein L9726_004262, partial [Klebsiella aerogenes]